MRLGIVGACGRGASFRVACQALLGVTITAACDTNAAQLPAAAERLGAAFRFTDFDAMLDSGTVDAVIVGTPMPLHVPQSVAALRQNLHVLSEVPAGVSLEECRLLVHAACNSSGIYMMAENYLYTRSNVLVTELARCGLFGTPYYAEGEYLHELKALNEATLWRRRWQTGINGNTYPTHSLGPLLQWMPGDRVVSLLCVGAGQQHRDAHGLLYENEATTLTLCRTRSGALIKLRLDMLSDRPHAMTNYALQGTDGAYESSRASGEPDRIWLRSRSSNPNRWSLLTDMEDEFLPDWYRAASETAQKTGHGGGDFYVLADFVSAARGEKPPTVDVHTALDMTLPGLISQASIAQGGVWLDVPDSREW